MKLRCPGWLGFIAMLLPFSTTNAAELNCTLFSGASITSEKTGILGLGKEKLTAESNNTPSGLSIAVNIEKDHLTITGNNDRGKARYVGQGGFGGKQKHFIETSLAGNIILWTLHLSDNKSSNKETILISQKSYNMMGAPFSYMDAYKCQYT